MNCLKHPQIRVPTKGLLLVGLLTCSCSNAQTSKTPDSAHATQGWGGGQLTQHEAEQSAIAEFNKANPGGKMTSYRFDKLIYKDFPPSHSIMNGYFLCGQIEYRDSEGHKHGPARILVYIMKDFRPALILYDYPKLGRYVASSFCAKLQSQDNQPPNG